MLFRSAKLYVSLEDFGPEKLSGVVTEKSALFGLTQSERDKQFSLSEAKLVKAMGRSNQKDTSMDYEQKAEPVSSKTMGEVLTSPSLQKLALGLSGDFTTEQVKRVRDISLSLGGVKGVLSESGLAPWQEQARKILETGDFSKTTKLKNFIQGFTLGKEPVMTGKDRAMIDQKKMEINPYVNKQLSMVGDYQKEYVTPEVLKVVMTLVDGSESMEQKEKAQLLVRIASLPRGSGKEQKYWNPAPANYQIQAREMIRGGKFGTKEILSLTEQIKKLSIGNEAKAFHKMNEVVSRREKILSQEVEKGLNLAKGQQQGKGFDIEL